MLRSTAAPLLRQNALPATVARFHAQAPRALVSTVLLTRYENAKVTELRTSLKERGLSTAGKRQDLLRRLLADDTSRAGSAAEVGEIKSQPASSRAVSSSAPAAAKVKADKTEHSQLDPTVHEPGAAISPAGRTERINEAGPSVAAKEQLSEPKTNPPGLPPQKERAAAETFNIQIPYYPPEKEASAPIPLIASYVNFEPSHGSDADKPPSSFNSPKVITMSAPDTYHGGGVSHHNDDDHHPSSDPKKDEAPSPYNVFGAIMADEANLQGSSPTGQKILESASGAAKGVAASAQSAAEQAIASASAVLGEVGLPKLSASSASAGGRKHFSSSAGGASRPLNGEETTGLYVLGGIVAGGLLLGGLGKPKKEKDHSKTKAIVEKAKEVTGVSSSASSSALPTSAKSSFTEKGRVGKALGDVRSAVPIGSSSSRGHFSSGAGVVGSGPRKV